MTVKLDELVPAPAAVVTEIGAFPAALRTVAVIDVAETILYFAVAVPNFTARR